MDMYNQMVKWGNETYIGRKLGKLIPNLEILYNFCKEKYGLNNAKIGLFGDSSGGHLALMTAFAGEGAGFGNCGRVQAVAVWYPVTDILMYYAKNPNLNKGLMGKTPEEIPEEYKRASPVNYASKDNPPVFLMHGEHDKVVPIKHSEKLFELLKDAGAGVSFLRVKNAGHGFGPGSNSNIEPEYSAILKKMLEFYDKQLK